MRAVWYERQGKARDVLVAGELPDPKPGPGEVRVRIAVSGVNPGDVKKREGWLSNAMPYPRVVPHSDGAGILDAVGDGVSGSRVGQRVWVYGAQSYRPFGTAAEYTVVPEQLAVPLPDGVSFDLGASIGIPGITAHTSSAHSFATTSTGTPSGPPRPGCARTARGRAATLPPWTACR